MYARRDHREPSLILEAVASYDLWIWHAFFGLPGSHNDINVLDRSPIFTDLAKGRAPSANYSINGHEYTTGYYLADGIYPSWATFVKTIPCPNGPKATNFAAAQEPHISHPNNPNNHILSFIKSICIHINVQV